MKQNVYVLTILIFLACLIAPVLSDDEHEIHSIAADYPLSFSSKADLQGCDHPRLEASGKGWCPETNSTEEWLQVSSIKPQLWTGVITQGSNNNGSESWVKEYLVSSTLNGKDWQYVDNGRIFVGNIDQITKVKHYFDRPVIARSIKIHPLKWFDVHIHLFRVEFVHKHL